MNSGLFRALLAGLAADPRRPIEPDVACRSNGKSADTKGSSE